MFSVHVTTLSKSPEVVNHMLNISQLFYQLLTSDTVSQEHLSQILAIYRNADMLPFYKSSGFRSGLKQNFTTVLLQVRLMACFENSAY